MILVGVFHAAALASAETAQKSIAIIATGGTIAGVSTSDGGAYRSGAVGVDAMLDAVPHLRDLARFTTVQVSNIGSQDMTDEAWLALGAEIKKQIEANHVDGVVVTHGTDTLEETAFFLDMTFPSTVPIVLTAAMRPSDALGADGPSNLLDAVRTALSPNARRLGVLVVTNGAIHSARRVTKSHTENVGAIASRNGGLLGEIVEAKPEFYRPLPKRPESKGKRLAIPATLSRVDIILSYADVDPAIVDFFVERGAKGLILAGVGNGNTRKPMIDALARASAAGIIVVRSSRLMDGWVSRNIEIDDDALGFVAARDLNPAKARVLLKFALEKTRDPAAIQRWFDCPAPTASGECLDGAN